MPDADPNAQLAADTDPSVKSACELLDRLMKDIVTETRQFDLDRFIPLLRERILVKNCTQRGI